MEFTDLVRGVSIQLISLTSREDKEIYMTPTISIVSIQLISLTSREHRHKGSTDHSIWSLRFHSINFPNE
jgi:hypothetical protein